MKKPKPTSKVKTLYLIDPQDCVIEKNTIRIKRKYGKHDRKIHKLEIDPSTHPNLENQESNN